MMFRRISIPCPYHDLNCHKKARGAKSPPSYLYFFRNVIFVREQGCQAEQWRRSSATPHNVRRRLTQLPDKRRVSSLPLGSPVSVEVAMLAGYNLVRLHTKCRFRSISRIQHLAGDLAAVNDLDPLDIVFFFHRVRNRSNLDRSLAATDFDDRNMLLL